MTLQGTGDHHVGVRDLVLADGAVAVRVWYPALGGSGGGVPASVAPDRVGELVDAPDAVDDVVVDADPGGAAVELIGTVDPDRVAVGGHSAGGSLAFETALVDPRIDAVVDLDGALVRRAATDPVEVPGLVVVATRGLAGNRAAFPETFAVLAETPDMAIVELVDGDHFDPLDFGAVVEALPTTVTGLPLGPVAVAGPVATAMLVRRPRRRGR